MIEAPHIGDSHDAASLRDEIKSLEQEIRDKQRILDLLYSGKHDLAEKLIEEGTTTAVIVLSQFYSKPDPSMLTGKDALLYYNLQEAGYIMTLQNMRASWNRGDDHSEDMSDTRMILNSIVKVLVASQNLAQINCYLRQILQDIQCL